MKIIAIIIISFLFTQTLTIVSDQYLTSGHYLTLSSAEKIDLLWERVEANKTPADWYFEAKTLKLISPFYNLKFTFEHKYDIFPESREKFIHSQGVIAKVKLVITNPIFTGMLAKGNENCLLRLSTAKEYKPKKNTAEGAFSNFVPSMALKCLIDGKQSVNLVAMFDITGQKSWNFFKNSFKTNFDTETPDELIVNLLINSFTKISKYPNAVGISDFSKIDQHGKAELNPQYPFYLEFAPVYENQKHFDDHYTHDWKDIVVSNVKKGSKVYDIIAHRIGNLPVKIGELIATCDFTTSYFSDRQLFFRHQRLSEDDDDKGTEKYRDLYTFWKGVQHGEDRQEYSQEDRKENKQENIKCPFSKK